MVSSVPAYCGLCGAALPEFSASCPSCSCLDHAYELERLTREAREAGQRRDWVSARSAWQRTLLLLPEDTPQRRTVQARIENIDAQVEPPRADSNRSVWAKRFAKLGPAGVLLWKFKAIALIVLTKGKLLLLGLTKIGTLLSMLASFALYWHWYGWRFAFGFVLSIYVHEIGHVAALRKYGIAATAPMFIPGFGAVVRLKQYPASPAQDARVGLAGPIWGLGAAVVSWLAALGTGLPIWNAIAHAGTWINLFNLIPVWQLDGGRGFRALTRKQRGIALAISLFMWTLTREGVLLLISLGILYRLFSRDYAEEEDAGALVQYGGLIVSLSLLYMLVGAGARPFGQ